MALVAGSWIRRGVTTDHISSSPGLFGAVGGSDLWWVQSWMIWRCPGEKDPSCVGTSLTCCVSTP